MRRHRDPSLNRLSRSSTSDSRAILQCRIPWSALAALRLARVKTRGLMGLAQAQLGNPGIRRTLPMVADLTDSPKRAYLLAQLERVCRLHRMLSAGLQLNPDDVRQTEYEDSEAQRQRLAMNARFTIGLQKIRKALIAECHDQGFTDELAEILRRYLNP